MILSQILFLIIYLSMFIFYILFIQLEFSLIFYLISQTVCKPKNINELVNDKNVSYENISFFNEINRDKRQAKKKANPQNQSQQRKNRCYLALVADHRFFKEIGNSNVKLTTAYLVRRKQSIYQSISWNLMLEI